MTKWHPNINKLEKPLYMGLVKALEEDIEAGRLKPGDQLPPQRELADLLGINLSTVTRAFRKCELKGLLSGVVGRGTFVSADVKTSLSLVSPGAANISQGPDQSEIHSSEPAAQPIEMGQVLPLYCLDQDTAQWTKDLLADMDLNRMAQLIQYADPAGDITHRRAGAQWLGRFNLPAEAAEVVVTAGSQNAIACCFLTLFTHGDRVAVDALTYPGIKTLAALHGIRLVALDMDEEGMQPQNLAAACKNEDIKGVYLMPECQNPTAKRLSAKRRQALAKVIKDNDLILIEDDAYAYNGDLSAVPLCALVPDQGIYIGSTSKLLGPGFRTSFVKVPKRYLEAVKKGVLNTIWMASPLTAELVSQLIVTGKAEQVISSKRTEAKARNELATAILGNYQLGARTHGFYQWIGLPKQWWGKGTEFEWVARAVGVQVYCAEKFLVGSRQLPQAVRIALSGPASMAELERGLLLLKKLLESGEETEMGLF